eukprot:TRINITY_DN2631_c0_g1_i17.p1 TRINITY_DN2631_c0_g1~~TRINITY_DN2631_c0_g1_i17.p1  ORF type:complete len:100 (+),score=15.84 TRINITY_DN2631_c0_g1_i17:354-653(+)
MPGYFECMLSFHFLLNPQKQWSQLNDVSAVLISVRSLLCDPNPDSPANQTAAKMFQEDIISYHMKVKEIVRQSEAVVSTQSTFFFFFFFFFLNSKNIII